MAALKKYQVEISKHVPLARLLAIKRDNYQAESGQDYCPFSIETAIVERSERLAASQIAAIKRWEKTLANYQQHGIGGMCPPPPKITEPGPVQFIIRF